MRTKKKILSLVLALAMVLTLFPVTALAANSDLGTWADAVTEAPADYAVDTTAKTVTIGSADALAWFAKQINSWESQGADAKVDFAGYTINITADIDLSAHYWIPIDPVTVIADPSVSGYTSDRAGSYNNKLLDGATINGNNHTISGMTIHNTVRGPKAGSENDHGGGSSCYYYAGFIGRSTSSLTIQNMTFSNATVDADNEPYVGIQGASSLAVVLGHNSGTLTCNNVNVVNSTVTGYTKLGGFTGYDTGTLLLTNCSVTGSTFNLIPFMVGEEEATPAFAAPVSGYKTTSYPTLNGVKVTGNTVTIPESCKEYSLVNSDGETEYFYTDGDWNRYYTKTVYMAKYNKVGDVKQTVTINDVTQSEYGVDYGCVAAIGDYGYDTLSRAIAVANTGDTVTLLTDTEMSSYTGVNGGRSITLDLGTHTLEALFYVYYGNLTVKNGTITGDGPFDVYGGSQENYTGAAISTLTIESDVTIQNPTWGICLFGNGSSSATTGYGAVINVYGEINVADDGNGIFVSGNLGNDKNATSEVITALNSSNIVNVYGTVTSDADQAIAMNGQATVNIFDGAVVTGDTTIGIKRGTLNLNGGTLTATGAKVDPATANNNGTESTGAALSVTSTYNYAGTIDVNVSGGTIVSQNNAALYVGHSQKNSVANKYEKGFDISVTGGSFSGASDVGAVYIADAIEGDNETYTKAVLTGGLFTSDPTAYCGKNAENKQLIGVASDNAQYPFTVGTKEVDVETVVSAGEPAASVSITDDKVTAEAVKNAASDSATQTSLQEAATIAGLSNDPDVVGTVEQASHALTTSGVTVSADVTVVVQPYLDVDVQSADTTGESKTMTVEIEAKYNVVATTADDPEDIDLTGASGDKNAVIIGSGVMEVTHPVTIKLPLPNGFVTDVNSDVFIRHLKNDGKVYVYKATVSEESGTYYATFVNPHGFSTFVLTTETAASITVGETTTYYDTLAEAVSAVQDGQTITILKAGETATVNRTVKFTVSDPGSKGYTINLGAYCTDKDAAADVYDIVYTAPVYPPVIPTTYPITAPAASNGTVAVSPSNAVVKGATVTVTATPKEGYELTGLTVTDASGNLVPLTQVSETKFTFTMPASQVTVNATFAEIDDSCDGGAACPAHHFTDVNANLWYHEAIDFVVENGIMNGVGDNDFNPNGNLSRAMLMTMLARMDGTNTDGGATWYEKGMNWAVQNGVSDGTNPNNNISRQEVATMLYRYVQLKGWDTTKSADLSVFADGGQTASWAKDAMEWAVANGIFQGDNNHLLNPQGSATRAEVAQIIMNFCENVAK